MKKLFAFLFGSLSFFVAAQEKWSLQDCVEYAVQNNLQIQQNNLNKEVQEKNLEIAQRQKLPSVAGSWSHNANFGTEQFGSIIQRNDSYSNNINVGANILLYNNGRLEKSVRKSQYDVEASQYDLATIKNDISLQVAQQYLSVLLNKEIVKISESALQNAQKIYDRAKITTEVGTTAKTVLAEAEAALAREKQNAKNAEINVKRSLFDLAQLMLLNDFNNFDIEDVLVTKELTAPLYNVPQVLELANQQRPEIKAAESRIKSAESQTEIAKTSFFPTITGSAGLGSIYFNSLNSNFENSVFKQYKDNFGQQVGVSANIPIFNKGVTRLQVEQAKINEEMAKTGLALQKQSVKQSVQKAQFDAESNYEIYLAAAEAEKSSKLALDYAEKSYAAGRSTVYEVNNARNSYANAQGNTAQAKYNYLFSIKLLNFYAGIPITL